MKAVEFLAKVNISSIVEWLALIDFTEWPQMQDMERKGTKPEMVIMVADTTWHNFGEVVKPVIDSLTPTECTAVNPMLSLIMPGYSIRPHVDEQPPYWCYRIHVPLITNPDAIFIADNENYYMTAGSAYKIDTRAVHQIINNGITPRIHLMWDINQGE